MDERQFRRSGNIEDRRKEKLPRGTFSDQFVDAPPNVFENGGIMPLDPNASPVQRTRAGVALGQDDLERTLLKQQQDNQVRDALDNAPVAVPGVPYNPSDPPLRIDHREGKAGGGPFASPAPLMSAPQDAKSAIVQAAKEAGVDPAYALAIAERESSFNPDAKSSRTIRGLYQMRGDLRAKYGVGDSADPLEQARGWMRSLPDIKADMKSVLGRDVTDQEAYLGHHFGAKRAARTLTMDPSTPVESIFTPQEMAGNPHFARAATIGNLNSSVMGDVDKRMARFGGPNAPSRSAEPADLSSLGEPVDGGAPQQAPQLADLSSLGDPVEAPAARPQPASPKLADLSSIGDPVQ